MKDIFKNPNLYYILIPILTTFWPLLVITAYLPNTEHSRTEELSKYNKAQEIIGEILKLDPDRLDFANSKKDAKFDYATAVDNISRSCDISATNYNISSKPIRTSDGRKTQNATVILKDIDITRFAKFLSAIQLRWANLQCDVITLTKKKGLPDTWKINLNFKYYYY